MRYGIAAHIIAVCLVGCMMLDALLNHGKTRPRVEINGGSLVTLAKKKQLLLFCQDVELKSGTWTE